jgi:hypothetical protein
MKMCATSSVEERDEGRGRMFDLSVAQYDDENIVFGGFSVEVNLLDDYKIQDLYDRFKKNGFKGLWADRGFYYKISYKAHEMGNVLVCFSLEHTKKKVSVQLEYDNLHTLIEMATRYIVNWEEKHADNI